MFNIFKKKDKDEKIQLELNFENYERLRKQYNELSKRNYYLNRKIGELQHSIIILKNKINLSENTEEVSGEVWELKLSDNIHSMVNGQHTIIKELYIPKWKIAFNYYDGNLNIVIVDDELRYKNDERINNNPKLLQNISFSIETIKLLKTLIENKEYIEKLKKLVIDEIKDLIDI